MQKIQRRPGMAHHGNTVSPWIRRPSGHLAGMARGMLPIGVCGLLAIIAMAGTSTARASVTIPFSSSADYTSNFRLTYYNVMPSVSGGYLSQPEGASTIIYDQTPADGTAKSTFTLTPGTKLTISIRWYVSSDLSSIGLYIIDPQNENTNVTSSYLSLININSGTSGQSAATERFRFWSDVANPVDQNIGTNVRYDIAADAGTTVGQWMTVTWSYALNESGLAVMGTTINGVTEEVTINSPLTTIELGLRLSNRSGTYGVDDWTVTQSSIPEPLSFGLLGLAPLAVLFRRRT